MTTSELCRAAIALLLLLCGTLATATPLDCHQSQNDTELEPKVHAFGKRWYSIDNDPESLAWPVMGERYPHDYRHAPFAHKRWVRYCHEDQRSLDNLHDIMLHAVAIWTPAMDYSTLEIVPDPACRMNRMCLCGPKTAKDSLRIYDGYRQGKAEIDGDEQEPKAGDNLDETEFFPKLLSAAS